MNLKQEQLIITLGELYGIDKQEWLQDECKSPLYFDLIRPGIMQRIKNLQQLELIDEDYNLAMQA